MAPRYVEHVEIPIDEWWEIQAKLDRFDHLQEFEDWFWKEFWPEYQHQSMFGGLEAILAGLQLAKEDEDASVAPPHSD